ncbi:hypothetical protein AFM11_14245 [Mycolicibacterium wolinskyi]|uniref:Uncharacterized protein n=1 Tax=Mycolicibacterium wolinskyi TaxID=59750 RepID=A0A132PMA3_9MYCO|nr:hypothetical protein AFM11_14245 [Mycolicibacterium wolinskyi]
MDENSAITRHLSRYGIWGFIAAATNTLFLEFATWVLAPWLLYALLILPPIILTDLAISALVARCGGVAGQIGRGLMIGCIAAPASLAIFVPVFIIAHAIGPI